MKKPILIAFSLLIHVCLFAQTQQILFVNAETQDPIADVLVTGEDFQDFSNARGLLYVPAPSTDSIPLQCQRLGYQSVLLHLDGQRTETQTIELIPTALSIDAVVVSHPHSHRREFISELDIELRPLQNSQEILRIVPGLFIGQHAGGGKAEQIFLRGFDIDHGTDVQLSVDGMPVNMVSHAHGQGYADLHFVMPELLERVDFGKGPYLAEQGNFTTAGWVNFRTKKNLSENLLQAEVGQFDTYRLFGAYQLLESSEPNGRSAYLAGEYHYSNSFFDAPQNFQRLNALFKYNDKLSPSTQLTFTASHFDSEWNHSGQIPARAVKDGTIGFFGSIDPTEGGLTSRTNVNLQTNTSLDGGGFWSNQLYYSRYAFTLYSNFTFFLEDPINGDQLRQDETRDLLGYRSDYLQSHRLMGREADLRIGGQYRQDFSYDNELAWSLNREGTRERLQYGDIQEANLSFYIAENIRLNPHWQVEAGLRGEYFHNQYRDQLRGGAESSASASDLLPKLSISYSPNTRATYFLKGGKGFHSNDTRVVVARQGRDILPAAWGSDLGLNWKLGTRLLVQPTLWYLWLDQEFVYVGDGGIVEPSGQTQRLGADLSVRYQLTDYLFSDLDLSFADGRSLEAAAGENYIPLAPRFTSVGGLSYLPPEGFGANLRYRYLADRPANEDNSIVAEGYFIMDAQLRYKLSKLTISLLVNNILDTRWKETQFATESRLADEIAPVEEIHFTPGSPFFTRLRIAYSF